MDPNQQPQDFNKPNEPTENPSAPQMGAPAQSDFSQPAPDFSGNPEAVTPPPVSQPFGQPVEANQPLAPQPSFTSPQVAPVNQPPVSSGENPGQVLGIVSIVMSVIGLSLIGLILGVISRKKSKAVGASTTLGTIGMVMGIVFTVIGFMFFLLITLVAYGGIQDRAKDVSAETNATMVEKKAEAYYATTYSYPATIADFEKDGVSSLSKLDFTVNTTTPTDYKTVKYVQCSNDGAQVIYYSAKTETIVIKPLGTASSLVAC